MNQEELKEQIYKLNDDKTLTAQDISEKLNCSMRIVRKFLRQRQIELANRSRRVADYHFDIVKLWLDDVPTNQIAQILGLSSSAVYKYMVKNGMRSIYKKSTDPGQWDKDISVEHKRPKKSLEEMGLAVIYDGQKFYDVSEFMGVESVGTQKVPTWKIDLQEMGIVYYGDERIYGKFGSRASERNVFYAKNQAKDRRTKE